jgi:hypothetical protein
VPRPAVACRRRSDASAMLRFSTLAVVFGALVSGLQNPPPATEIFLAPFAARESSVTIGPRSTSPTIRVMTTSRLSRRMAHQCFLHPFAAIASQTEEQRADGSDIYRYDIKSGRISQVTNTKANTADRDAGRPPHFSDSRRPDGVQRLWKLTLDGKSPAGADRRQAGRLSRVGGCEHAGATCWGSPRRSR